MAITSSTFGRTIRREKDAEQMLKQIRTLSPNANAKRSLENASESPKNR